MSLIEYAIIKIGFNETANQITKNTPNHTQTMHLTQNRFFMQINFSAEQRSIQNKDGNVKCYEWFKTLELENASFVSMDLGLWPHQTMATI